MKKAILISIATIMFFTSCNEKKQSTTNSEIQQSEIFERNQSNQSTQTYEQEQKQKQKDVRATKSSVMIDGGWTLCKEDTDGTMISKRQTQIGDSVNVVYINGAKVEKTTTWKIKNNPIKNVLFILVEYEGEEYWSRDLFIADESNEEPVTAVMTLNSYVYKTNDEMSMTSKQLDFGTKVAFYPTSKGSLKKICIYNGRPYGEIVYVDGEAVSTSEMTLEYYNLSKRVDEKDLKPEVKEEIMQIIYSMEDEFISNMEQ